jgi:hypothetical protein
MSSSIRDALLKTLTFHETWGHAPTAAEWIMTLEGESGMNRDEVLRELDALVRDAKVINAFGKYCFPESTALIDAQRTNEFYAPRKRRIAGRVTKWLACLGGVRFVALCNSTALGHARDEGDLDFFVIVRHGTIMQTRALAAMPFKLLGRRPGAGEDRDAVCLSYFISDKTLDMSSHMLTPDDPYFRYWFLSLLPLFDDGISMDLWNANVHMASRHPFATPWIVPPDLRIVTPQVRIPTVSILEGIAGDAQRKAFPSTIRELMNRDTRVMVRDDVLKFHVTDGREEYRTRYEETLRRRGVAV